MRQQHGAGGGRRGVAGGGLQPVYKGRKLVRASSSGTHLKRSPPPGRQGTLRAVGPEWPSCRSLAGRAHMSASQALGGLRRRRLRALARAQWRTCLSLPSSFFSIATVMDAGAFMASWACEQVRARTLPGAGDRALRTFVAAGAAVLQKLRSEAKLPPAGRPSIESTAVFYKICERIRRYFETLCEP